MKKKLLIGFLVLLVVVGGYFFRPKRPQAAGTLTAASATLANPRLSYYGKVSGAHSAGDTTIAIKTSGSADNNTNNLFPGDTVSVGINGGRTVGSIIDGSNFALTEGLTVSVADDAAIYATQSGALTITFTITNDIPANGYVRVLIPDAASDQNDGAPDTAAAIADNGFDLNGMGTGDVETSGGTGCTWSTETLTAGTGSSHQYKVLTTTACTAGAITVAFDGTTKDPVNPAPVTSGHTQGTADVYAIDVDTYDGDPDTTGQLIDTVDIKVAPVEAVLVSATVDETLSFAIAARGIGTTACDVSATVASTVTSIPWGLLSAANTFSNASQQLTVSTNADAGYTVKIEENDQMGYDGTTCNVPTDATADETDNPPCIKDTVCGATACSEAEARNWTDAATYHGLGISLEDVDGTDAVWDYDGKAGETTCTSGTFCARQIADQQVATAETKATIMTNTGSVSSKDIYVCYRIAISNTQPAGYYYNKVKYTATATF